MIFTSKRARTLRDAKVLTGLLGQIGLPYALEADGVIIAGDDLGQKLAARHQIAPSTGLEPFTFFDEQDRDRRFTAHVSDLQFGAFKGRLRLFRDITERQKLLEDAKDQIEAMHREKSDFSDALNNLSFPIWIENDRHQVQYHNARFIEHFGPTVPQAVREVVTEAVRSGDALLRRVTGVVVKGERKQLEVKVQPLPDKRVVAWAPDRTDFMDEIGNRDRLLSAQRNLFEQLHTAVAMFDHNQRLTFYNSAYSTLWGLDDAWLNTHPKMDDVLERLRADRRLPEQADFKSYKNYWRSQFTELLAPKEDMLYLPDSRTLRMLTVPNPSGGLLMTFEDVTSTLELESSFNTLLAVQRETLDNMTEAMAVIGGDGRVKLWNQQYAKLWGLFPEDLSGNPHISALVDVKSKRFTKDAQARQKQILLSTALDRNERKGRFVFEDGRNINHMAVPLPDGATLLAYDDVTDAVHVEQALRDKASALEAAEQLKLDFLANVSYQLRTPLNAIIGFAELLEHQYFGQLNERQMDYARGITDAGQRLLSLVDDILDLSTIEAGYLQITRDSVDVGGMVESVYRLTEEWARKSQHDFTLSLSPDIGLVQGDERRLKQALLNLIRNAIAFTPRGGKIDAGAARDGGTIRIWIKDNGVGIAPEDQARIFKAFERIDGFEGDDTQRQGAGLGLSLVKSIVDLHGGGLTLNSAPNEGTEFIIDLPVKE